MIKKITVQNFFSFGAEQTIELNADTNILVGINGTGKSNFIKAIRLLQEGIKGNFEKLFSQKWGGFSGSCNFIHPDADEIKISYCFDKSRIEFVNNVKGWDTDIIYGIVIRKNGIRDYSLSEEITSGEDFYFLSNKMSIHMVSAKSSCSIRLIPAIRFLKLPDRSLCKSKCVPIRREPLTF